MKNNKKFKTKNDNKNQRQRGVFFSGFKKFLRLFIKRPKLTLLSGELESKNSVILTNHVGASAPLKMELYYPHNIRLWGAHQMNDNLRSVYKYQSRIYYHQKKGWPLFSARLFCLIAAPLTYLFYRGLRLIPTYQDARFRSSLSESISAIKSGQNIVIFPEDSSKGYFDKLTEFRPGFVKLLEVALQENIDLNVVVAYLNKKKNEYIFDKPILASKLISKYPDKEDLAEALKNRCNELGEMTRK